MINLKTKIKSAVLITRPVNVLITFISVLIAGYICKTQYLQISVLILAAISAALINSAGNIINDIYDIEVDKVNNKNRVLSNGALSVIAAKALYAVFNIVALALALYCGYILFVLAFVTAIVLFIYSFWLKKIPLSGNITVAFFTGLAFIYGGVAAGGVYNAIVPATFAFLINLAREVIKDMEDITGDISGRFQTFPVKYGFAASKKLVRAVISVTIALPFALLFLTHYKLVFFIITILIINPIFVFVLKSLFIDDSKNNLKKLSMLLKLNMVLGLAAVFFGV
jgi:geranylgeranylglycerol-phosphate geranylgeranyltransferase